MANISIGMCIYSERERQREKEREKDINEWSEEELYLSPSLISIRAISYAEQKAKVSLTLIERGSNGGYFERD